MKSSDPSYPINEATLRLNLVATYYVFLTRLRTYSRYKGQIVMSVISPILFAMIPILMGTAFAGENATTIFQENTGTTGSFHGYMLVGALFLA
ncbi:MAG: hypothetical protein ACXACX_18355 [Candidatus Hodarchaeales archaeon]|jgi:hypothetical protein